LIPHNSWNGWGTEVEAANLLTGAAARRASRGYTFAWQYEIDMNVECVGAGSNHSQGILRERMSDSDWRHRVAIEEASLS
jgi:hypothetical protein